MQTIRTSDTPALDPPAAPTPAARAAVLPVIAAVTANMSIAAVGTAALDLDRQFAGLDTPLVAATTAVSLVLGVVTLSLFRRFAANGIRSFRRLAAAFTTLSLTGPVTVLWSAPPDGPAHSRPATAALLAVLHLVAGGTAMAIAARTGRS